MSARGSAPFDELNDIPDPVAAVSRPARPLKEIAAPAEPSMTRAERRRGSFLALAFAIGWIGAVLARLGFRSNVGALSVMIPVALWVLVAAAGLAAALRPGDRGMPASARALRLIAALIPVVFLASSLIASHDAEPAPLTLKSSLPCMVWAIIAAAGPFVLAGLLLKRTFLSAPRLRGGAIGALCGLCAAAAIHVHCPMTASAHVIVAHGFPIVAGGLLGALFGALRGQV